MHNGPTVALIVAAGSGSRSGSQTPKQFARIAGRSMLAHAFAALVRHARIDRVVVVVAPGHEDTARQAIGGDAVHATFVSGGATRRESVAAGLNAIAGTARVLIHDAARPFVRNEVVDRLLDALDDAPGAVPILPVSDTVARADATGLGAIVPRDGLVRVQTPQAFDYAAIRDAHDRWPAEREATDDAQMLRATGGAVAVVEGSTMLDKITYPDDFAQAEARYGASMRSRSATGFDVHRLEAGEELWLGGVRIPHDRGLSGHSDADVALHAITDAILGTIAAGDIGTHFPPSDPQWRGAESGQFLTHAADLVRRTGGIIDFVDVTMICEAPKIGPHRAAMRTRIAALLDIDEGQVSIKATTSERLGFTGREEGIAAQAIATVRVPEQSA